MSAAISVITGDITTLAVDAIVNAANTALAGGGGVDGAIHRAAGPALAAACLQIRQQHGGCPVGQAVLTVGGRLPAPWVIHTVGPVWRGGTQGEAAQLQQAYLSCLQLALEHRLRSIAFPAISTGVYGFPKAQAAGIALATVQAFIAQHSYPEQVIFSCFDRENARLYQSKL